MSANADAQTRRDGRRGEPVPVATISVSISTVGRPSDLARCLTSLLEGSVRPAEVVVVDQSTDRETSRVIDVARESGLNIVRHANESRGLGVAQNAAVAASSHELVAVLDDDCIADRGWIEAVAATLESCEVVTGPILPLPAEGERVVPVSTRTSLEPRAFGKRDLPWHVGSGNNFALRREWFDRIGGCDERLGPGSPGRGGVDMDLFYRLLRAGARIRYEPHAIVHHARTTPAGRRARRVPYGFGMGACCVLWLRERDLGGLRVLAAWFRFRLGLLARACFRGRGRAVAEELLILAGTIRGMLFGLRA